MKPNNPYRASVERLETAASSFSVNRDFESCGKLVDAVLAMSHRLKIPEQYQFLFRDKLSAAEVSFWRGESPGVPEATIVSALNALVRKLGLPRYAETTDDQIRFLRMGLIVSNSAFMAQNVSNPNMRVGDRISSAMSPLQALHVTMTLIDQKFYNPLYQVSPEEWPKSRAQYEAQAAVPSGPSIRQIPADKTNELRERLDAALIALSDQDAMKLVTDFETALGFH